MNIGKRLQEMRQTRGLTTHELATGAKVTTGFLRQLERSTTTPLLQRLQRVATVLRVPWTYLLLEDDLQPQVVRAHERHDIPLGPRGGRATLLSPPSVQQLEVILLELQPGAVSSATLGDQEGQECHLVLQGTIRAYYGNDCYLLEQGDTIFWDGSVPHSLENVGTHDAQLLITLTPAAFLQCD